MRNNWFFKGLLTNFAWWFIAVTGGAVLTVLARIASSWAAPAFYGLAGFTLISVGVLALRSLGRIPRSKVIPTPNNIEALVRLWLNNFRVGVKNDPVAETIFRVVATMDGGTKLIVGRPRGEFSGYLIVRAEITPTPEEQRRIAELPEQELQRILSEVKLELVRAKVSYSGLMLPITTVVVFKRIPISEALTEDSFIAKLEEVEAAVNAIAIVTFMGFDRNRLAMPTNSQSSRPGPSALPLSPG